MAFGWYLSKELIRDVTLTVYAIFAVCTFFQQQLKSHQLCTYEPYETASALENFLLYCHQQTRFNNFISITLEGIIFLRQWDNTIKSNWACAPLSTLLFMTIQCIMSLNMHVGGLVLSAKTSLLLRLSNLAVNSLTILPVEFSEPVIN